MASAEELSIYDVIWELGEPDEETRGVRGVVVNPILLKSQGVTTNSVFYFCYQYEYDVRLTQKRSAPFGICVFRQKIKVYEN